LEEDKGDTFMLIDDNAVVLFQGDSITDAGRGREDDGNLGQGYVNMIAAWFAALHSAQNVRFLNRGISGNRAKDLAARWQADAVNLRPDWISIMIGINDTWRRFDAGDPTPVEQYAAAYRSLLESTRRHLDARLVLCEPFVLPTPPDRRAWREDLDPKIHVARDLAREFGAILVPLDGLFAAAATQRDPAFWAADGVHPTQAGHALIAQAWLRAVGALA
jgi:acyl-CoA thioesterase I